MTKVNNNFRDFEIVIVDIEGTTTSINFVKDVLFKYARENVEDYLLNAFDETATQELIEELRIQIESDDLKKCKVGKTVTIPPKGSPKNEVISPVVKNILTLMDTDSKTKPLKPLQGYIWKNAYESGAIKGHVYEDVIPALKRWLEEGKDVYIYSSGSVQAQKLLFQYSEHGNILKYFKGHFDTSIGLKRSSDSYRNIAEALKTAPEKCLFVTDILEEANAASEAGMTPILSERPGNEPLQPEVKEKYQIIRSFDDLFEKEEGPRKQNPKRQVEEEKESFKKTKNA